MENINDGLLDTYLFECNSLLERLDEILIDAERSGDLSIDDVNEIFRSMHTIKGSSAMMEFQPLMEISHHVEDLFFVIRENGMDSLSQKQKNELFNLLFRCVDRLREDLEKVTNGEELNMNIDGFIAEINSFLSEGNAEEDSANAVLDSETLDLETPNSETLDSENLPDLDCPYFIHIMFDEDCGMENLRAFMVANALEEEELVFLQSPANVESDASTIEVIAANGFYLGFTTEEDVQSGIDVITNLSNIRSYEIVFNPKFMEEDEPEVSTSSSATPPVAETAPSDNAVETEVVTEPAVIATEAPAVPQQQTISNQLKSLKQNKQSLISVNLSKLDKLMDIVGEIVITESMVTASPELQNVKLDSFLKSTRQLRKLTDDLQDVAMSLRMIPIAGTFQKMNRIVRDMAKTLDKDVKLTIIGEDTEIDKTIVENISDPIMHIVRNAMDHGIEKDVQSRIAAGKNPQGEIILSAQHASSEVIITIENDGADFNTDAILNKAEKKGLLFKAKEDYSKKEILSLLMLPGFSTNAQVTEFSGRGVGLDVVKRNVEAIGGSVTITNDPGQNCCFTLKIPLTLAIVDGMELSVGNQIFTLPIANIKQSFKATAEDIIYDATGNEIVRCMDEFYPIVRLHSLFNIDHTNSNIEDGVLVWVESMDRSYCLFIDALIGEQQVVVKPLPPFLNQFNIKQQGISGCTILGDGNISLILDINHIYTAAQNNF